MERKFFFGVLPSKYSGSVAGLQTELEAIAKFTQGSLRHEIENVIKEIEKRLSYLTAHGKRYVNIVTIDSEEIPEMDFRNCSHELNELALIRGYEALPASLEVIQQAIEDRA